MTESHDALGWSRYSCQRAASDRRGAQAPAHYPSIADPEEASSMARRRVLLIENDAALEGVLCYVFGDEGLDVTVCASLAELQAGIVQFPRAAVVSDSLRSGDYQTLSTNQRAELLALAETSEVVLWADHPRRRGTPGDADPSVNRSTAAMSARSGTERE